MCTSENNEIITRRNHMSHKITLQQNNSKYPNMSCDRQKVIDNAISNYQLAHSGHNLRHLVGRKSILQNAGKATNEAEVALVKEALVEEISEIEEEEEEEEEETVNRDGDNQNDTDLTDIKNGDDIFNSTGSNSSSDNSENTKITEASGPFIMPLMRFDSADAFLHKTMLNRIKANKQGEKIAATSNPVFVPHCMKDNRIDDDNNNIDNEYTQHDNHHLNHKYDSSPSKPFLKELRNVKNKKFPRIRGCFKMPFLLRRQKENERPRLSSHLVCDSCSDDELNIVEFENNNDKDEEENNCSYNNNFFSAHNDSDKDDEDTALILEELENLESAIRRENSQSEEEKNNNPRNE